MNSDTKQMLAGLAETTKEGEFFNPMPSGYKPGQTKYVVVFGTVMSGLGKGIFSSSLAKVLKDKGLAVAPIKLEGYLNVDSGTLNPFRHGEVFVLDDGMETDMDLGTYERMLDQDLTRGNFVTSGQIYSRVLEKERLGKYLGHDVQMIPHVTGEVKLRLRELAMASDADVVFVEVGGTVGNVENLYLIEAIRELAYEEGQGSVVFVCLTYIIESGTLGEQKSKAAQLGVKRLLEMGIQPNILALRCDHEVTDQVRQKISMFCNVPLARVFSMHDRESIYMIPEMLREAGLDKAVLDMLGLEHRVDPAKEQVNMNDWREFVASIRAATTKVKIGLTGKYVGIRDSYASIIKALEHCGAHLGAKVELVPIDTTDLSLEEARKQLETLDGIIVPGGFGKRGVEGKIACVQVARESQIPFLGICLGFQMAVIEFARHVCGLAEANSTEFEPDCPLGVIDILPEQKKLEGLGGNMRLGGKDVELKAGSLASILYNSAVTIRKRFRHRYEVDPAYIAKLEKGGLVFSGKHPVHPIMQVLELPQDVHPYFIAGQFHPELTSRPLHPEPMFMGLVKAALQRVESRAGQAVSAEAAS